MERRMSGMGGMETYAEGTSHVTEIPSPSSTYHSLSNQHNLFIMAVFHSGFFLLWAGTAWPSSTSFQMPGCGPMVMMWVIVTHRSFTVSTPGRQDHLLTRASLGYLKPGHMTQWDKIIPHGVWETLPKFNFLFFFFLHLTLTHQHPC